MPYNKPHSDRLTFTSETVSMGFPYFYAILFVSIVIKPVTPCEGSYIIACQIHAIFMTTEDKLVVFYTTTATGIPSRISI